MYAAFIRTMEKSLFGIIAVLVAAVSVSAAGTGVNSAKARQALDGPTYAHFSKEIKDRYPREVAAYAIVDSTVTRVFTDAYCPRRGALCGPNPGCKHEKVSVQALDLKIERVMFSTGPFKWPDELLGYPAYRQGSFKQGDRLQVSLYGYRTGSTGILTIHNLGTPPAAEPAPQPQRAK